MSKFDGIQTGECAFDGEEKSDLNENTPQPDNPAARNWKPSARHRFPHLSFIALLVVIACCGGLIVILYQSNGKNSDTWCSSTYHYNLKTFHKSGTRTFTITVNVWISILVFIAGKAMAFTFAEAVTTAWWVRAMEGRTLKQLHHNWDAGRSIMGVLKNPRMFNVICLGSIAFTCFAGLGALFQKATSVVTGIEATAPDMSAYVAVNFPAGWSGTLDINRVSNPRVIKPSSALSAIKQNYNKNAGLVLDVSLCDNNNRTTCEVLLPAVGFQYDCQAGEMDFEGSIEGANLTNQIEQPNSVLFGVYIDWAYSADPSSWGESWNPWTGTLNVMFKTNPNCLDSTIQYRNCTLTPALVNYPVTVSEKTPILKPPTASPNWTGESVTDVLVDSVNRTLPYPLPQDYEVGPFEQQVTVGALYTALSDILSMQAIYNGGHLEGGNFDSTGAYTSTYFNFGTDTGVYGDCNSTWNDPLPDIALQIRDFMFRTAIELAAKNVSSVQSSADFTPYETYAQSSAFHNSKIRIIPIYETHYLYLWIGAGLMLLAVLTTVPLFYGYWRLGRSVSLSPLEMAKAMNIVGTDNTANDARNIFVSGDDADAGLGGSNADTQELLHHFGGRQVKYGEVAPQVLGFSFRERVQKPRKGGVYL